MKTEIAVHEQSPPTHAVTLMNMISKAAGDPTMDVVKLQTLLEVKRNWEADEARKAFHRAFAAFKAEAIQIVKNKVITDGPLKGRMYADLFAVVTSLVAGLSKHGLSHSWSLVRDEKDWLEVACILTHVDGHSEIRKMGGPPDTGGAKSPIQARASSVSYLERYTFLAVTGMTASDQDNDGRATGAPPAPPPANPWNAKMKAGADAAVKKGLTAYSTWWGAQSHDFREASARTEEHAAYKKAGADFTAAQTEVRA